MPWHVPHEYHDKYPVREILKWGLLSCAVVSGRSAGSVPTPYRKQARYKLDTRSSRTHNTRRPHRLSALRAPVPPYTMNYIPFSKPFHAILNSLDEEEVRAFEQQSHQDISIMIEGSVAVSN